MRCCGQQLSHRALLIKLGLEAKCPEIVLPSLKEILKKNQDELDARPKEIYSYLPTKHLSATWDEVLEELESQSCAVWSQHGYGEPAGPQDAGFAEISWD